MVYVSPSGRCPHIHETYSLLRLSMFVSDTLETLQHIRGITLRCCECVCVYLYLCVHERERERVCVCVSVLTCESVSVCE